MRSRSLRQLRGLLALLLCAALVAAGCGSDDDTEAAGNTSSTVDSEVADQATESDGDGTEAAAEDADQGDATGDADAAAAALVEAATAEGSVTVYSSQGLDQLNALADAFEAAYPGIEAEIVRGADGDTIPRVETELSTGSAGGDLVILASKGWVLEHAEAGDFVDPTASPALAGLGDYDAEQYLHEGNYFEVGAAVLSFAWNTDELPAGLSDMEDLLDPSLAGGKLAVIDPAIAPAVVDYWLWVEENFGREFVEALAAQEPRIYPSALPIGEALASGEVFATPYAAPGLLEAAKADGAPVDFGLSDKGVWGARFYGFIPTSADGPAAAALFADFMLSAEGQELINPLAGSILPDIPGTLVTNDQVRDQDLDATAPEPAAAYVEAWDELFR